MFWKDPTDLYANSAGPSGAVWSGDALAKSANIHNKQEKVKVFMWETVYMVHFTSYAFCLFLVQ